MLMGHGAGRPGLIIVLGGARSGKSRYAEELAARLAGDARVVYIATATAYDDEMRARIARHRAERPVAWATLEAPRDPAAALRAYLADPHSAYPTQPNDPGAAPDVNTPRAILLDCLTLLAANLLTGEGDAAHGEQAANEYGAEHATLDATLFDPLVAAASEVRVRSAMDDLVAVAREHAIPLIVVTNEVGMGVVPAYPLGRVYRDILGRVNAQLVAQADAALLMLAGLPIELKALTAAWQARAQGLGW